MAIFERPDVSIDDLVGSFFGLPNSGDAESTAADGGRTAEDHFAADRDTTMDVDGPPSARPEVEPLQIVHNGQTWIIGG